jgi:hypothetical protein
MLLGEARPALERIETGVRRDPVEPRTERRPSLEASAFPPCPQERLLHEVLGVLQGAEHAVAVQLQLTTVRLDELGERRLVAGPNGGGDRSCSRLGWEGLGPVHDHRPV